MRLARTSLILLAVVLFIVASFAPLAAFSGPVVLSPSQSGTVPAPAPGGTVPAPTPAALAAPDTLPVTGAGAMELGSLLPALAIASGALLSLRALARRK